MAGEVRIETIVARAPLPPAVAIALCLSIIEAYAEQDLRPAQLRSLRATIAADRVAWIAGESGADTNTAEYLLGRLLFRLLTGRPWTVSSRLTGVTGAGHEDATVLVDRLFAMPPDLSGCRRWAMEARRRTPLDLGAWLKVQFPAISPAGADLEAWTGVYPAGLLAELMQQRNQAAPPADAPTAPLESVMLKVRTEATPVPASTPMIVAERLKRPSAAMSATATMLLIALTVALTAVAVALVAVLLGGSS